MIRTRRPPRRTALDLPPPAPLTCEPLVIDSAGTWLVLGDVHLPYHDPSTVEAAVAEARRRKAVGVLLNGDILDSHEISTHDRDPSAPRYRAEIECCRQFLAWLRARLPRADILYKEGNHDARLRRYIATRAEALFDLPGVSVPELVGLADIGGHWIADKRTVKLGKLHVLHGHEFRGGGGVNPARWLFLRAVATSLCGHFHRTSEHHERTLAGKTFGVWSVGCACYLSPGYDPNNKWNHGYGIVDVASDGTFHVDNRRLFNGAVL